MKLNVDAALLKDSTFLAIVPCDDKGEIMKAWSMGVAKIFYLRGHVIIFL